MKAAAAPLDLDRARKLASAAHVAAIIAVVVILLLAVADCLVPAVQALGGDAPDPWNQGLRALIPLLPLALMASALFKLRMALDHYSDGLFFAAKPARHIADAGSDVVWSIVAMAGVVPNLLVWTSGEHGGFRFHIEPYMVGLFAFALFVMVVGRILEAAAAIKAENDQIV